MAIVCNLCKRASSLILIKGEMLCDHCSPIKGMIDYHKKLVRLKNLKNDKSTMSRTSLTKDSLKMNSGKTLTIKKPEVNASVDRAKEVAKMMKTVVKKSK